MERLLALARARGAAGAEAYQVEREETSLAFAQGRPRSAEVGASAGLGLRLVRDGRIGFSSTTALDTSEQLVEQAMASAPYGQPALFVFPGPTRPTAVRIFDDRVAGLSTEELIRRVQEALDYLQQTIPEATYDASARRAAGTVTILNSAGLHHQFRKTLLSVVLGGTFVRDGRLVRITKGESSSHLVVDPLALAGEMLRELDLAQHVRAVPSGRLPVIVTARALDAVLLPLRLAVSGRAVARRESPLAGRLGQRIADARLSILDDGRLDLAPNSAPVDDEGVPSQCTPLIQDGVLVNLAYDLQTAGLAQAQSTGNGFRHYNTLPSPRTTNLVVAAGDATLAEMIAGLQEGLLVEQVIGKGQSEVLPGELVLGVTLGYRIAGGEIAGRVVDTMIAGNLYDSLQRIRAIGNEPQRAGSLTAPAICFDGLHVTSRQK